MSPAYIGLDLELFYRILQPRQEPLVDRDRAAEETDEVQLRLDDAFLQLPRLRNETRQERVERLGELVNGFRELLVFSCYSN
jgi:hypothetical protein